MTKVVSIKSQTNNGLTDPTLRKCIIMTGLYDIYIHNYCQSIAHKLTDNDTDLILKK